MERRLDGDTLEQEQFGTYARCVRCWYGVGRGGDCRRCQPYSAYVVTGTHSVGPICSSESGAETPGGVVMASGDTLVILMPYGNEPTATNYATLDTRNQHPCLDFDATTNEYAVWSAIMPRNYAGSGLTVYLHYAMSSAEADTIDWDAAFERIGDQQQDLDADGFAAVQSVDNTTVPGTTGLVDIVNITFTNGAQMDSISVGELFRIKINRDAASDDAAGDAELCAVEIKET